MKTNSAIKSLALILILALGIPAFHASAQTTNNVSANGASSYNINTQPNPTLSLTRGVTYVFVLSGLSIHPFWIKTNISTGSGAQWTNGVINNGSTSTNITFAVPTTPLPPALTNTLFYNCGNHPLMHGLLSIVDPVGPTDVRIVYISVSNNVVIQSTGTNTWGITPFVNCDLTTTNWTAITSFTNTFANGTNTTIFPRPDVICGPDNPAFFRIQQHFP